MVHQVEIPGCEILTFCQLNMWNFESLNNHELLSNDINNLVKAIKHE